MLIPRARRLKPPGEWAGSGALGLCNRYVGCSLWNTGVHGGCKVLLPRHPSPPSPLSRKRERGSRTHTVAESPLAPRGEGQGVRDEKRRCNRHARASHLSPQRLLFGLQSTIALRPTQPQPKGRASRRNGETPLGGPSRSDVELRQADHAHRETEPSPIRADLGRTR